MYMIGSSRWSIAHYHGLGGQLRCLLARGRVIEKKLGSDQQGDSRVLSGFVPQPSTLYKVGMTSQKKALRRS